MMQMTRAAACRGTGDHAASGAPGGRRSGPVAKCLSERGDDRSVARLRAMVVLAGAVVLLALVALQAGGMAGTGVGTGAEPPPPAEAAAGG